MREADQDRAVEHSQSIEITNRAKNKLSLHLEPWGDEFLLQPMECVRVIIIGPDRRAIPVSYTGDTIVVEAWEDTTAEVWKGDQRLN